MVFDDNRPHSGKPLPGPVAVALQEKLADLLGKLIGVTPPLDFRQYGIRRAQKPYWEPETEE